MVRAKPEIGEVLEAPCAARTHEEAMAIIVNYLEQPTECLPGHTRHLPRNSKPWRNWVDTIEAIGHRVVHGGDQFKNSVLIDGSVMGGLDELRELAPLHNPPSLDGIHAARNLLGRQVPMVAVFDTTFHRSLPERANTYALPRHLASKHHIHRYGFHGIAHASLAAGYAACTQTRLHTQRLITLQLGHGCSITAIDRGRSVDTSMGFTPLEGLVMGTRSGDLDPAIVGYLARREQISTREVEHLLNTQSGLLGISGLSADMKDLLELAQREANPDAGLAIEVFCYRVRKYLGAYLAALEGADALVFGGGIGEHSPEIRARVCQPLEWCGLRLHAERNAAAVNLGPGEAARISADDSSIGAYVVATDEETWIAKETARCVRGKTHFTNTAPGSLDG